MKYKITTLLILAVLIALTQTLGLTRKKLNRIMLKLKKRTSHDIQFTDLMTKELEEKEISLGEEISSGSFGVVYHAKNNPNIVVKGIQLNEDITEEMLKKEMKAMDRASDLAFSLPLCDQFEIRHSHRKLGEALILPKATGDLFDAIQQNHRTKENKYLSGPNPLLHQFIQMVIGLKEFHEETGFAHRDIKPENYLVVNQGEMRSRIVLADFGSAEKIEKGKLAEFSGTPGYIPFDGINIWKQAMEVSQKFDTFALGVTYLTLTVPEFFICMYSKKSCKFKDIKDEITDVNPNFSVKFKEFRERLNEKRENEGKNISEEQKQIDRLVFKKLLVNKEKRLNSLQFLNKLKEIVPSEIEKVQHEYGMTKVGCEGKPVPLDIYSEISDDFSINKPQNLSAPKLISHMKEKYQ